jgi:hypothetical protein
MIKDFAIVDPPTMMKEVIEVDVPKLLAAQGLESGTSPLIAAVGDMSLIASYFLLILCVGDTQSRAFEMTRSKLYNSKCRMLHFSRRMP